MGKIRIGNDIVIAWTLKDGDGNPYDLRGRDVEVHLRSFYVDEQMEFEATGNDGNIASFTFYGKDQGAPGKYNLLLIENKGEVAQVMFDVKDVFELVKHSWETDDESAEGITTESVQIVSTVSGGIIGPQGPAGNGIASAVLNADYTLTLHFTDGTSYTTPSIRGAQGPAGSDADVTYANVIAALGFTPASSSDLAGKQDTLVSGTNIKTINDQSILGEGNIVIQGGGGSDYAVLYTEQSLNDAQKAQARTNIGAGTYSKPSGGIPATDIATGAIPSASNTTPKMDGTAAKGSETAFARGDHVHPHDTSKQDVIDNSHKLDYSLIANTPTIPTVPAISNDISADATSTTKTASPKAVVNYVDTTAVRGPLDNDIFARTIDEELTLKNGGVAKTKLASDVQTSLGLADTAYQKPSGGIPASDIASGVIPTVPAISNDIATDATSTTKTTSPKAVKDYVDANAGSSLPSGGAAGQVLAKASAADDDVEWANIPSSGTGSLPAGGTKGMTLVKQSSVDSDAAWEMRDENKVLIIDQTFTLDRLQPTSYDSATGYYTVDSFPSWVTAANGATFYGQLNIVDFTNAASVPYPDDNSSGSCSLTKIDATHFSIGNTAKPSGTPNPAAFFFTEIMTRLSIPRVLNAKTRYRLIVENGASLPNKYNPCCITTRTDTISTSFQMPLGIDAISYIGDRPLQTSWELEFTIDTTGSTTYITSHSVEGNCLAKDDAGSHPFINIVLPKVYGNRTFNSWQVGSSGDFSILGPNIGRDNWIHDGTRVRVYILL